MSRSLVRVSIAAFVVAAVALSTSSARADGTIRSPGDHPEYHVEIEPHFLFGFWENLYPGTSYGVGGRFSIPVVHNGFVPSINNSVAVSFGLDFLHYDGCYARGFNC